MGLNTVLLNVFFVLISIYHQQERSIFLYFTHTAREREREIKVITLLYYLCFIAACDLTNFELVLFLLNDKLLAKAVIKYSHLYKCSSKNDPSSQMKYRDKLKKNK